MGTVQLSRPPLPEVEHRRLRMLDFRLSKKDSIRDHLRGPLRPRRVGNLPPSALASEDCLQIRVQEAVLAGAAAVAVAALNRRSPEVPDRA